jgi:hypothetical protein
MQVNAGVNKLLDSLQVIVCSPLFNTHSHNISGK